MSKQLHYVVKYDTETDKFFVDEESTELRFDGAVLYDDDRDEWRRPTGREAVQDIAAMRTLQQLLEG